MKIRMILWLTVLLCHAVIGASVIQQLDNDMKQQDPEELDAMFSSLEDQINEISNEEEEIREQIEERDAAAKNTEEKETVTEVDINLKNGFKGQEEIFETSGKRGAGMFITKWPKVNGELVVPYVISSNIPKGTTKYNKIINIIETMNKAITCNANVWRPRTTETSYVEFQNSVGCSSYVGKVHSPQPQPLNLADGCVLYNNGTVLHEMMHAMGFFHEHSRIDRDNYVEIKFENIMQGSQSNFNKQDITELNSPYDYGSVMHYPANAFSSNGQATIVKKDLINTQYMGQRNGMSAIDIKQINDFYDCPPITTAKPLVTSAQPVVTTIEPVVTTAEPVTTTAEPIDTTTEPVVTTTEPVVTTTEPVTTTAEPIDTTTEPVVTTAEPIDATTEPLVTTIESVVTTAEPVVTTAEPVLTTPEPVVTTAKPVVTTAVPVFTTAEPVITAVITRPTTPKVTTTPATKSVQLAACQNWIKANNCDREGFRVVGSRDRGCRDYHRYCRSYVRNYHGLCQTNWWVKKSCRKSCGFCGEDSYVTLRDIVKHRCLRYRSNGWWRRTRRRCIKFEKYIKPSVIVLGSEDHELEKKLNCKCTASKCDQLNMCVSFLYRRRSRHTSNTAKKSSVKVCLTNIDYRSSYRQNEEDCNSKNTKTFNYILDNTGKWRRAYFNFEAKCEDVEVIINATRGDEYFDIDNTTLSSGSCSSVASSDQKLEENDGRIDIIHHEMMKKKSLKDGVAGGKEQAMQKLQKIQKDLKRIMTGLKDYDRKIE